MDSNKKTIEPYSQMRLKQGFIEIFRGLDSHVWVQEFMNSMPYAAAVLNENRQVVFSNKSLLTEFGFESVESILGRKPGEVLRCIHSLENNDRCGVSDACRLCGAYTAIRSTREKKEPVSSEFRVTSKINNQLVAQDFIVNTIPMILSGQIYMILYLRDISHEKRRKTLERIFFHDVINKVSTLNGFIDLLLMEDDIDRLHEHIEVAQQLVNDLTDEILNQRQLASAENGDLTVRTASIKSLYFLGKIVAQIKQLELAREIMVEVHPNSEETNFVSDPVLLNRVITNMLKNAIEASEPGDRVIVSTSKTDEKISFSVHNTSVIPTDTKLQIFQRSFSTKGTDRGLGTYSIKLLTERYLRGKAWFESATGKGTTFYIELDLMLDV